MTQSSDNRALRWFSVLTAAATLGLIAIGGLVTSHGVGMAVPDWPNSYGYNMFLFPVSKWVGGIFYEHTHRLVASVVGVLVVILTRWLGGKPSRLPLALIGLAEVVGGQILLRLAPEWKGAGHFLSGIGGVVLLAALVWVRNAPAKGSLPGLGWVAFAAVQLQGLLGGLRVVLLKNDLGIFHAALAQLFFVLLCAITLLTTRYWQNNVAEAARRVPAVLRGLTIAATVLIFAQLVLGATMRHQHAGLAIPDFPLAYGKVWPATDPAAVELYNQQRFELTSLKPITGFQIQLQMAHRLGALFIVGAVGFCAFSTWRRLGLKESSTQLTLFWFGLILVQALLGAATIWSNKAADIATGHVVVGALSLATGAIVSIFLSRNLILARQTAGRTATEQDFSPHPFGSRSSAITGVK